MKRFSCLSILIFALTTFAKAQNGFYTDGYLLYNKDTTWCRIWFNPGNPNFNDSITVWHREEAKVISLLNNKDLTGFGITQEGYQMDFGRIRLKGFKSGSYFYIKKIVTGAVELYQLPFMEIKKDPLSYKLLREEFAAYFIARTDDQSSDFPTQLKQLKKKKIAPFIKDFPGLDKITDETMTADEVANLLKQYNAWFTEKKKPQ